MNKTLQYFKENDKMLDLYTFALTRAHGRVHPEVYRVREIYGMIQKRVQSDAENFGTELQMLKDVTKNFEIPDDACETYIKTYEMLETVTAFTMKDDEGVIV